MTTRYSRPARIAHAAIAPAWFAVPLLLLAFALGVAALSGAPDEAPAEPDPQAETPVIPIVA